MTNQRCVVCDATKPGAQLCRRCTNELEQALAELPAQHDDLTAVATRQAAGPLGLGDNRAGRLWNGPHAEGSLGDSPWVFAPGAADQLWAFENTVTAWAADFGMDTRQRPGERFTVTRRLTIRRNRPHMHVETAVHMHGIEPVALRAARHLLAALNDIRQSEHAAQLHDELTALAMENSRWTIGDATTLIFAGRCKAIDIRVRPLAPNGPACWAIACGHGSCAEIREPEIRQQLLPAVCGADLFANPGANEVKCTHCGLVQPLLGARGEIEGKLDDQWARPHLIADSLTTLEEPVNASTLRTWIERDTKLAARLTRSGMAAPHPMVLQVGIDDDGNALYRVGDVRARVAWVRSQARLERATA